MTEITKKQKSDDFENRLKLYKVFIGTLLFLVLVAINAFIKELPIWYMVAPAFLLGINPEHLTRK